MQCCLSWQSSFTMEVDWNSYINFPEDIENTLPSFFTEGLEGLEGFEGLESIKDKDIENIEDIEDVEGVESTEDINSELEIDQIDVNTSYQYNLHVGDIFDDWESVTRFMHNYCLERGFGYQVCCNDKDAINTSITRRKSR